MNKSLGPSSASHDNEANLSLGQVLDQLYDTFESAWKLGQTPSLELHVARAPEQERTTALQELLHIEIAYRIQRGELPRRAGYVKLFPAAEELIKEVFSATSTSEVNLIKLIGTDIQLRKQMGQQPTPEDYAEWLPQLEHHQEACDRQ